MDVFLSQAKNDASGLSVGILIMENLQSRPAGEKMDAVKRSLEESIREEYGQATRADLKALHPMDIYISYYKKFGYTYHVLPQLESVIKGKSVPSGFLAVEAMFMAELKNMLLSAAHDLDKIKAPLALKAAAGDERFTAMGGRDVTNVPGDFLILDQEGVISSILRGPDQRTAISADTSRVIFTIYAPRGVEESLVAGHLSDIEAYVRLGAPESVTSLNEVIRF